jgi:hypothetical protein
MLKSDNQVYKRRISMKPEQLDFDTVSAEKLKMLEEVKDMVFSTCSGNHVTSRIVSTSSRGTKFLFASFRNI